ncbi:hypothetical protein N473_18405 [Pseudoalteromonas luteoviolacea CPMOR-1]|uniref:Uncharacterized protein n=1 Tax=Pseudoalteromonas luteoviolacea CPMOR-1 TaxID=1365248 RepID=A0A162C6C7_9GAMM|nr:hypothetical protein N473_18405 [Pseudoalteromonas luteoviolacea CPMOR-1]
MVGALGKSKWILTFVGMTLFEVIFHSKPPSLRACPAIHSLKQPEWLVLWLSRKWILTFVRMTLFEVIFHSKPPSLRACPAIHSFKQPEWLVP